MIALKSAREIEIMRRSGKITANTLSMLLRSARPGMTLLELDRLAEKSIREQGGIPTFKGYHGFPASICASVNDVVVHGIPTERALKEGDRPLDRHRHDLRRLRERHGGDHSDRQGQRRGRTPDARDPGVP